MLSLRLTTIGAAAIGAAVIGLGTAATAGAATTSRTDDAFVTQVTNLGIAYASPQEALRDAYLVCAELATGRTGADVATEILNQTTLTPSLVASFVIVATKTYCPQLSGQLQ